MLFFILSVTLKNQHENFLWSSEMVNIWILHRRKDLALDYLGQMLPQDTRVLDRILVTFPRSLVQKDLKEEGVKLNMKTVIHSRI